jgi:predicted TIM-barrel fold metal-dependent hydrolase
MIIDAHTHLGYDYVFRGDFTHDALLTNMNRNKIDISIVQPGTVLDLHGVIKQHNAIAKFARELDGRIIGMANPNPYLPTDEYHKELERCVKNLGFVGVKLHPLAHAVDPGKTIGEKVFKAAMNLDIPVMVHTGIGVPWALPSTILPRAMEFPELRIVLAHAGSAMFSNEALLTAKLCPNVYLETSWLPSITIQNLCQNLGAERIMFGSDHGENVSVELEKYRSIDLSDEELKWCLGRTAAHVFNISPK